MSQNNSKVFITGIDSFTGKYVANEFALLGYEIYGSTKAKENVKNNVYYMDLLDQSNIENIIRKVKPRVVIHLAAITFIPYNNIKDIYDVNVIGTLNLLVSIDNANLSIDAILLPSSANVYGNPISKNKAITEAAPTRPNNHYAVSKMTMENIAKLWLKELPIIITRPFNYSGVGQSDIFLLPKIVNHFKNKKKNIELGNIHVKRDFSDVRFLAEAYRKLITKPMIGEVVNICSGVPTSIISIISMMEKIAGYQIKININQKLIRENDIEVLYGSNIKLLSQISGLTTYKLEDTLLWIYSS